MKKLFSLTMAFLLAIGAIFSAAPLANAASDIKVSSTEMDGAYIIQGGGAVEINKLTDSEGDLVYCLDYSKEYPTSATGYTMETSGYKAICPVDTAKVKAVLSAGYPAKSPSALGVDNANQAYYATQLALWTVSYWRSDDPYTASDKYPDVYTLYKGLVAKGNKASGSTDMPGKISLSKGETTISGGVASTSIKVSLSGYTSANISTSGDITVKGGDTTVKNGDTIVVEGDADKAGSGSVTVSGGSGANPIYYTPVSGGYQPVVKVKSTSASETVNVNWEPVVATTEELESTTEVTTTEEPTPEQEKKKNPVKTSLTIIKIDSESNAGLSGAKFAIFNEDGEVVAEVTTNNKGTVKVKKLALGKYTIKEIEAPAGYMINNGEKTVTLSKSKPTAKVVIADVQDRLPQTGENFAIFILIGAAVASVICVIFIRRKKTN